MSHVHSVLIVTVTPLQVQQIILAQQQQQQLAAQVAGMRAMAKTNPGAVAAPGAQALFPLLTAAFLPCSTLLQPSCCASSAACWR